MLCAFKAARQENIIHVVDGLGEQFPLVKLECYSGFVEYSQYGPDVFVVVHQ